MVEKCERVCGEYHVHEEGDDEDMMYESGGGGEEDNDDGEGMNGESSGDGREGDLEVSERTERELAFIVEMRKVSVRH